MELTVTFTQPPVFSPSAMEFLKDWVKEVRGIHPDVEPFKKDMIILKGKGRHFCLISHHKKRVAKKNYNRALKKGLPGVSVLKLTGCYPIGVEDMVCD